MEEYLKTKDCAKVLAMLYRRYFNRFCYKGIYFPLKITEKQRIAFIHCQNISKEEIWAYANKLIDLSEGDFTVKRNENFKKREFLKAVISPLVQIFTPDSKKGTTNNFNDFIFENHLCDGIEWLNCEEDEPITVREKDIIVKNIKKFFVRLMSQ